MSATYKNGEKDDVMSEQKHSTQLRLFLGVALAVLTGFVIPTFGQDAPAPAIPPAPNTQSSAQNPAKSNAREQQATPPARLSPEDSVAPRTNVDTLAEIKKSGKLRVGVSMIIPWAMHDKDGNLIGFEIDVAKKMARDLGVEVEFYPDEFHYLIPDLLDNRFDLIISGFSMSTNRAMQVNFSAPYNYTDCRSRPIENSRAVSRNSRNLTSLRSRLACSTPAPRSTSHRTRFRTRSSRLTPKTAISSMTCSKTKFMPPSPIARGRKSWRNCFPRK